jgi:hypothetical protein
MNGDHRVSTLKVLGNPPRAPEGRAAEVTARKGFAQEEVRVCTERWIDEGGSWIDEGGSDEAPARWTCGYCGVEARWMSDHEQRGLPANWTENQQGAFCLACRRELAAEAAVSRTSLDLSFRERARLRSFAVIEFEVRRDPCRSNAKIANAVHTSVVAVQKARQRLDAHADENDN